MIIALSCGFMHHLVPATQINFERLHIFLFNLCSGGTLLIYFTEGRRNLSRQGQAFFLLALLFALAAFCHLYVPAMLISLLLAAIVERARVHHFGRWLPLALLSKKETVSNKFHQASLLCLSIGLTLSAPVILNAEFGHWIHLDKLELDTFFLGFSFPISLISMSVIFNLMNRDVGTLTLMLKAAIFWCINLGVIIFFLFILAELFVPQIVISSLLFLTVTSILYLYWSHGIRLQQKAFLTSGILFLLVTSLTGIAYILLSFSSYYIPEISHPLLRLHAFTALYGWNLSGLAVISRHGDFPIQLHSKQVLILHWVTVLIFCPLGYFMPFFAVAAVFCYCLLLVTLLFKHGTIDKKLGPIQPVTQHPSASTKGAT